MKDDNQETKGIEQKGLTKERLVAFTISVIKFAGLYEGGRTLSPVFNQIIRSAGSIGANVSEASGSVTKNGFAHYFHIALQSANETRYWINVLQGVDELATRKLDELENEVAEFIRILTASLKTMKKNNS